MQQIVPVFLSLGLHQFRRCWQQEVDNVQTLCIRSDTATRRVGFACYRGCCLPCRVCIAVLGLLQPGAAVYVARWKRINHGNRSTDCRGPDDDGQPTATCRDRRAVGPLQRKQLHSLHVVLGQQLRTGKMLSKYVGYLLSVYFFTYHYQQRL